MTDGLGPQGARADPAGEVEVLQYVAVDYGRAEAELAWKPETSFEDGLRSTVSWYVENGSWREAVSAAAALRAGAGSPPA